MFARYEKILDDNNQHLFFKWAYPQIETCLFVDMHNRGCFKHLYSGFSWAVARAMLLHSGTFCMMEFLNKHF